MKTELGFVTCGPDAPDSQEVRAICEFLRGKGWMLSAEIEEARGISDRKMRLFAEFSDGRILSGQNGYRLFERSTPLEEADIAASWLESQGKRMMTRAIAIRRRYHRYAREREQPTA